VFVAGRSGQGHPFFTAAAQKYFLQARRLRNFNRELRTNQEHKWCRPCPCSRCPMRGAGVPEWFRLLFSLVAARVLASAAPPLAVDLTHIPGLGGSRSDAILARFDPAKIPWPWPPSKAALDSPKVALGKRESDSPSNRPASVNHPVPAVPFVPAFVPSSVPAACHASACSHPRPAQRHTSQMPGVTFVVDATKPFPQRPQYPDGASASPFGDFESP
jgi:hypothetical protein